MYQTLCNWTSSPTSPSSWGAPRASQPIHSEPLLLLRPTGGRSKCYKGVRASAIDVWDDLDHWQGSLSRPQLPSRRVDPAVLIGTFACLKLQFSGKIWPSIHKKSLFWGLGIDPVIISQIHGTASSGRQRCLRWWRLWIWWRILSLTQAGACCRLWLTQVG